MVELTIFLDVPIELGDQAGKLCRRSEAPPKKFRERAAAVCRIQHSTLQLRQDGPKTQAS